MNLSAVEMRQPAPGVDANRFLELVEGLPSRRDEGRQEVPAVGGLGAIDAILRVAVGGKLELRQSLAEFSRLHQLQPLPVLHVGVEQVGLDDEALFGRLLSLGVAHAPLIKERSTLIRIAE